jgi:hypothetical protein
LSVRLIAAVVGLVLVASVLPATAQQGLGESGGPPPSTEAARGDAERGRVVDAAGEATGLWVVQLDEPALASYTGGIAGLAPTSPLVTGVERLDTDAPASRDYLDHLEARHGEFGADMRAALGRAVEVAFAYRNVVNGIAVEIEGEWTCPLRSAEAHTEMTHWAHGRASAQ